MGDFKKLAYPFWVKLALLKLGTFTCQDFTSAFCLCLCMHVYLSACLCLLPGALFIKLIILSLFPLSGKLF